MLAYSSQRVGISVPNFVIAIFLIIIFASTLQMGVCYSHQLG